uniref:PAP-associated domain-containing protein n=1 Tax=Alexandrium catenella TaxID=2925 RepID=A0A7S1LI72_ALECA
MPGWAKTAQNLLEDLHTKPPKSYVAAQAFYATLQRVGQHVDVSEHCDILDALMGPLKEKADRDRLAAAAPSSAGSSRTDGLGGALDLPAAGRAIAASRTADEADSADEVRESCAALPYMAYPAFVGDVISSVRQAVSDVTDVEVRAFGSALSGFGDEASDVDLVVVAAKASLVKGLGLDGRITRRYLAPRALDELQRRLQKRGFRVHECRLGTQIPILKMSIDSRSSDHPGDVECDLSVNNLLPVFNTALLKAYADIDSRAVVVTQVCRRWAKAQGVHGAPLGHLSSYAFTLMVIFYMQVKGALPCLQQCAQVEPRIFKEGGKEYNVAMASQASMAWEPARDTPITFSGFVRFFCEEFEWGEWVVSVRTGHCFGKRDYPRLEVMARRWMKPQELGELIHIEDPFDTERNLNCVLDATHNAKLRLALEKQHALEQQNMRPQQALSCWLGDVPA